jgi:trehalose-6-phosphate synthase
VGWDGVSRPSATAVQRARLAPARSCTPTGIDVRAVPLSEREVSLYYHGFSNRGIWPLFHDFPGKAVFHPDGARVYARVNRRFAEVVLESAGPHARVWVHDFHLLLVPGVLRELGFTGRIDFFLHIPCPPSEIFRALPSREQALRGLLAADSVAFHMSRYLRNFADSCRELLGARIVPEGDDAVRIDDGARATRAFAAPIGIDVDEFERLARDPRIVARAQRIREAHSRRRILLSVDRLDSTKGILERLAAVERMLKQDPDLLRRVVLEQIVVPSRHQVEENRRLKREIDREVGRINGELGRFDWAPIHYRYRGLDRDALVAHYLAADVALVTPLRDGMNLVASEFAATRVEDDGALVISEFAGFAERATGAFRVNPYDVEGCAATIRAALLAPDAERAERMRRLRGAVRSNPVERWAARCLGEPAAAPILAAELER